MADESIEALERAWQDLFHRILKAGREQGERAAFDRILQSIQAAAAQTAPAAATPAGQETGATGSVDERQQVVPLRGVAREWDPPKDGDRDAGG